jgi:glycogen phosphorylase
MRRRSVYEPDSGEQPATDGSEPVRQEMTRGELLTGSMNAYSYTAAVPASRPASDFTPRIVPWYPNASTPLEVQEILWYR